MWHYNIEKKNNRFIESWKSIESWCEQIESWIQLSTRFQKPKSKIRGRILKNLPNNTFSLIVFERSSVFIHKFRCMIGSLIVGYSGPLRIGLSQGPFILGQLVLVNQLHEVDSLFLLGRAHPYWAIGPIDQCKIGLSEYRLFLISMLINCENLISI